MTDAEYDAHIARIRASCGVIGYKKVVGAVLELEVMGAEREGVEGQGYHTSHVRVLAAYPPGLPATHSGAYLSLREASFLYTVGAVVYAVGWGELGSAGIHYYHTRGEARRY